jgi:hypothetical protein
LTVAAPLPFGVRGGWALGTLLGGASLVLQF